MMSARTRLLIATLLTLSGSLASAMAASLRSDCAAPAGSIKREGGAITFALAHGQKGGCPNDRGPRGGAPWWERAELKTAHVGTGERRRVRFSMRFDPTARSGPSTSVFQIHTWTQSCPACAPAVMLKVSGAGALSAYLLGSDGRTHRAVSTGATRSSLSRGWNSFELDFSARPGENALDLRINGRAAISGARFHIPKGGNPYYKVGLYRPGSRSGELPTDRIQFRGFSAN